jgi:hypothetical protein
MQTFLPYADFAESARVLDRARIGKQRIENMTIMKALLAGGGYNHHPVTKQWDGYEPALMRYQWEICHEWTEVRHYKDTCLGKTWDVALAAGIGPQEVENAKMPSWLGDEEYHLSHQANLVFKDPEFYIPVFPGVVGSSDKIYPSNLDRYRSVGQ